MKKLIELLSADSRVSDYKINIHTRESYELFFVKGALETVRATSTCDKEVTVYADHGEYKGDAQFFIYPSTDEAQLPALIDEAVGKALLINNKNYELPEAETGEYVIESNLAETSPAEAAAAIANTVFAANTVENAALNSLEIFITRHDSTITNSRGLRKSQTRWEAMVEAIPTYNGEKQSVELYELVNYSGLDTEKLAKEISDKMLEVKARYEAVKPENAPSCPVVLHSEELSELFAGIAYDLNYSSVYSHSNLRSKGDEVQSNCSGDLIGITMAGKAEGCVHSTCIDSDGLSLGEQRIVDGGKVVNYFGSNRYGQYLGEKPTGSLPIICADCGSAEEADFGGETLEVKSMSGLQVDFYSDYIGGEVRLAYHHKDGVMTPLTGISISGKLSEVLSSVRFSHEHAAHGRYSGPSKAILNNMKIF